MSDQGNRSYRQGADAASKAARTGYRGGKKAYKAGRKIASYLPLKVKLVIVAILIAVILVEVIVGGTSSTSMDSTWFLTALNEADTKHEENRPENEDEQSSVYSESYSVQVTANLAAIISQARWDDRRAIEAQLQKTYGDKNVTVDCDTDNQPVYVSSTYSGSSGGIQGAIDWAIQIANDNEFAYGTGNACHRVGCYFCGTNQKNKPKGYEKTYVCMTFVHAAFAHGAGDPEMLETCQKGRRCLDLDNSNFTDYTCWEKVGDCKDLKWSDIQPGDVFIDWSNDGGNKDPGHACLYVGDNKIAEAAGEGWGANSITVGSNAKKRLSSMGNRDSRNYVMRYKGPGTGTGAGGAAAAKFTAQKSETKLQTISKDTGKRYNIGYTGNYTVAQSFAATDSGFAVAFTPGPETGVSGKVVTFDRHCKESGGSATGNIYHANGSCMSASGTFLAAGSLENGHRNSAVEFSVNGSTSCMGTKALPSNASSIAYDRDTHKYILCEGSSMKLYDSLSDSTASSVVSRSMHGTYYQDIGAGGGYIYACHCTHKGGENSGSNYIDVYNEKTGDYCGSYYVDYGELESADVVDGELVLLIHILGRVNYIQFTGIRVGSGGGFGTTRITKSDLQLLSAYSISLSNSELVFDKKAEKEEHDDYVTGRYFSLLESKKKRKDRVPVKLHWFGKDRGKINYEADLKSKVNQWAFYDRDYEMSESGDEVHVTLHELPAHKLCSHMFGLKPNKPYVNGNGKTKNSTVIYSMAENTAQLLFNGQMAEQGASGPGQMVNIPGGSLNFPVDRAGTIVTSVYTNGALRDDVKTGRPHEGIDLSGGGASDGKPIYAAAAGVVTRACYFSGYGNCVDIDHGGGLMTRYGHQSRIAVSEGDKVERGQLIGYVGNTGHSYGAHLHFEVRINGKTQNPAPYIGIKNEARYKCD